MHLREFRLLSISEGRLHYGRDAGQQVQVVARTRGGEPISLTTDLKQREDKAVKSQNPPLVT